MTSTDTSTTPDGGAWAAILSAALGCFCFGIAVNLSEAFEPVKKTLNLYNPSGDLTGKSTIGVVTWVIAWGLLHWMLKGRNIRWTGFVITLSVILIVGSIALVCPPVVDQITAQLKHLSAK